ncbi:hypothetical protein [Haloferax sp. ATB1]|uniref:hypothetical protein n=1 Tax=Haloferax sp. ATB1 TaxID=1508454 RepID=UPI000A90957E|nr:hypothetical protein [Haloferax sp. ATB1]
MVRKIVFSIYDTTTYRNLVPIAEELSEDYEVEYLLFDELLQSADPSKSSALPADELKPHRFADEYIRSKVATKFHETPRSKKKVAVQRIIEDNISPQLIYDIHSYIKDTSMDVFVSGHDRLPFIKHVMKFSETADFKSIVIQHGINRPDLEFRNGQPVNRQGLFRPSIEPQSWAIEKFKRRFGFNYGAFLFCSPYADEVLTMGDFFTERIRKLREQYPCNGAGTVTTVGYSEFNPGSIKPVETNAESALFLSQWQYEAGSWTEQQQKQLADILRTFQRKNNLNLRVRPHPKDSEEKISRFFNDFQLSRGAGLESDIENHDIVLTVDSTALLRAVLRGKVPGVIDLPWEQNTFSPFTHDHVLSIDSDFVDLEQQASKLSETTQVDYLQRFCYVPSLDESSKFNTPREYLAAKITSDLNSIGPV